MKRYLLITTLIFMISPGAYAEEIEPVHKYEFTNGYPQVNQIDKIYDELDYQRAVQSYLWATPLVAVYSFIEGLRRDFGSDMYTTAIWEKSATPRTRVFTGNSQSIYAVGFFDLSKVGPVILEFPPGLLGMVDDLWYAPVTDVGLAGPDKGKGGKYLILPPDYKGTAPTEGYHTFRSTTYLNIWLTRAFQSKDGKGDPVEDLKKIRVYPLAAVNSPPDMKYKLVSDINADVTFKTDARFYDTLGRIIKEEYVRDIDLANLGMLKSLGIQTGKDFAPDDRMKRILERAADTGNAMARAIAFSSRNPGKSPYPDRRWQWIFLTEKPNFYADTYLDIEARITYTHQANFTANGMVVKKAGAGSQYVASYQDSEGNWLDGNHLYKLHLPAGIPAKNFWSLMVYDSETRSMVVTDTESAGLDSYAELEVNGDGSIDLYVGPEPPTGLEKNWVKTEKDKGFFAYFRLFGPTQDFFDKSWVPGDFELIR